MENCAGHNQVPLVKTSFFGKSCSHGGGSFRMLGSRFDSLPGSQHPLAAKLIPVADDISSWVQTLATPHSCGKSGKPLFMADVAQEGERGMLCLDKGTSSSSFNAFGARGRRFESCRSPWNIVKWLRQAALTRSAAVRVRLFQSVKCTVFCCKICVVVVLLIFGISFIMLVQ